MFLDDFVEIIGGKVCNATQAHLLGNVTTHLHRIMRGDIFILRDKGELDEAINRGAYAIVSEVYCEISDEWVAFILVENLEVALHKFAKYAKLTNGIEIFALDSANFALARAMARDKNIAFARDIFELVEVLHFRMIFIDFEVIFFDAESIKNTRNFIFKINYQTLFELKIEYENKLYELVLPSIFISNLNDIMYFFKMRHIDFKINFDEDLLLPIFINTSAQKSHYGQSMRFIYASKNMDLFQKYITFTQNAKWGKTLILSNENFDNFAESNGDFEVKIYKNNDDLLKYFMLEKYHFFVIYGVEQSEIELIPSSNEQQLF
ncbi:hypothetical protein ACWIUD_05835 [Helicobacter sp. 23-1044]